MTTQSNHWTRIYEAGDAAEVSWFQERAELSLRLIDQGHLSPAASSIIDVGAGASTMVDDLMARGFNDLTVLDLASPALAVAQTRLGPRAGEVQWMVADVLEADLPANRYDVWHDRAVFHFLIGREERQAYVNKVLHAVKPGGLVIVATFAEDGPTKCSGLPVRRYSALSLEAEFGEPFVLHGCVRDLHRTPKGHVQAFIYCVFRKAVS